MTPDERERIEAAVREAVQAITGFSEGGLVPQMLGIFNDCLTPAIDALLASRDQRIAELEARLRDVLVPTNQGARVMREGFGISRWGEGFFVCFPCGYSLSVQFSDGNYCEHYTDKQYPTPTEKPPRSRDAVGCVLGGVPRGDGAGSPAELRPIQDSTLVME